MTKPKHDNTIKVEETRALFIEKRTGMPKAECLMSLDQICQKLRKPLPEKDPERLYIMNINLSSLSALKRTFLRRHVLFVAPKIGDIVFYGFTNDTNLIDNYIERVKKTTRAYQAIERTVKHLALEQQPSKQLTLTE
jgi:hypothetical protein